MFTFLLTIKTFNCKETVYEILCNEIYKLDFKYIISNIKYFILINRINKCHEYVILNRRTVVFNKTNVLKYLKRN